MASAIKQRKKARQLLMQALYQWQLTAHDLRDIQQQYYTLNDMSKCDAAYFDTALFAIPKDISTLDEAFTSYLDRKITDLNPIELTIIRLGTYELLHCPEVPYRVILNETINLAKTFGADEGHKYVNGILNKVAREVRKIEIEQLRAYHEK